MANPTTGHIVIVGAGIAGASLAWQLRQSANAPQVTLLERDSQPGMHSTGRSAAMFMESYGPSGVRALTRASRDFYERPPAGFLSADAPPLLTPRGALYVAMQGQAPALEAVRDELAGHVESLDVAQTLAIAPCLRGELVIGSLLEPGAQDIDVAALHQAYLRGFKQRGGVTRLNAHVTAARRPNNRWNLTLADGSALEADVIVNAAGAWCDELAACCDAPPIGITPMRRSAFTFAAMGIDQKVPDYQRWPVIAGIDEAEGWYFKPDAGQLLGSPANADPVAPHDVRPEDLDIALAVHRIESATTLRIAKPQSTWAGLRSFAPDGELVIGHDSRCPGMFWLAGQGGYGIQSAAGASALACALLLGDSVRLTQMKREHGVDPTMFSPNRLR
jgi:D-arginine dehydrogenase